MVNFIWAFLCNNGFLLLCCAMAVVCLNGVISLFKNTRRNTELNDMQNNAEFNDDLDNEDLDNEDHYVPVLPVSPLTRLQLEHKSRLEKKLTEAGILLTDIANNEYVNALSTLGFRGTIPKELVCPISYELMRLPITFPEPSNKTYDLVLIYLDIVRRRFQPTYMCPLSRVEISVEDILNLPIDALKLASIEAFIAQVRTGVQARQLDATPSQTGLFAQTPVAGSTTDVIVPAVTHTRPRSRSL